MNIILILTSISISIVKDVFADEHNHVVSFENGEYLFWDFYKSCFYYFLSDFSMKTMRK